MPTDVLPAIEVARRPVAAPARCLHCRPPLTPASVLSGRPVLLTVLATLFVGLAASALISSGALLLTWDEPIQRAVEGSRTAFADDVFRRISFLGSTQGGARGCVLAAVAWRRCRAVGVVVLLALVSRPLLEFTLKAVVGRDRPDLERLVAGNGPSFPSGHVMAAVALWGLVPLVVALYSPDRRVWWASFVGSSALIVAIGASRTYLGVHWFSDVIGGLIVGMFFLLGAEWVLTRRHRADPCTCRVQRPCALRLTFPAWPGRTLGPMGTSWVESDGALRRRFQFADFSEAFAFMTRVALLAEAKGHHPDWSNSWNTVDIALSTHSAGSTVTDADRAMAAAIDELLA